MSEINAIFTFFFFPSSSPFKMKLLPLNKSRDSYRANLFQNSYPLSLLTVGPKAQGCLTEGSYVGAVLVCVCKAPASRDGVVEENS